MQENPRAPRLAVLIDADNASPKLADDLFKEIAKIGEASVRRIYGDFSSSRMSSWLKVMPEHAILPQMNLANTTGKNASDIALVIDAMDLLLSERFDGFCLVSSDSDFTRLAARIREQGVAVYGFGEKKTPKSFVQACQRFIYTENLAVDPTDGASAPTAKAARIDPSKATPLLLKAMETLEDEEGWVTLGPVGQALSNLTSDFDPRSYGCAKLSDLVEKTGHFEMERMQGRAIRIREKPRGRRAAR
ncbi:NYN domain-containing protein [Pikeienuella piscinae]|uniref:NYN domain-containing protein n=1 Tax=Pikeienuella piscinae TaxID=2748098 RepID=A0A7L5BXY8_9RHOB|nr:NYN domain-containing protein [Pikeienuella piscinae]QIE56311.1 NYN domain-containing protein [Pikeienuella piscinae]